MVRRFLACSLAAVCAPAAGCAASQAKPELTVTPMATSQPAGDTAALDVQQLSGQIVAGVQAELSSRIETAVKTTLQATGIGGNATGYNSEFGVGATLVVTLTLILALILSHRRETLRIKQNGRHVAPCGKHTS